MKHKNDKPLEITEDIEEQYMPKVIINIYKI